QKRANLPPCEKRAVRLKKEEEEKKRSTEIKDQEMSRSRRFSASLDGDPRGPSWSSNLVPVLLLTSLFFASSAAVISCPADGSEGGCSPMDLRAALNRSRHSFATCNASAPPSQTPPPHVLQDPVAAAAKQEPLSSPPPQPAAPMPAADSTTAPPPAAPAASRGEQQPPIANFDEWTKQKLQQPPAAVVVPPVAPVPTGDGTAPPSGGATLAQPGAAPKVVPVVAPEAAAAATASRNYASRECGAKVIYSNPEAENTKAVLNDKEKDDYMRNPCSQAQHKHIVIELCETIQPRSIEIANFELFSSGPASVRFSAAERFPSQQWSVLGEWSVADTRTVQTLPVPADARIYAKFIKLELLAHHGAEHYCTLSTVRVLGVSMVDEYEAEAGAVAARLAAPVAQVAAPTVTAAESAPAPTTEETTPSKDDSKPAAQSTTPAEAAAATEQPIVSSTEAPPISVVEAPPVAPRTVAEKAPSDAGKAPAPSPSSGIVQEVMSGQLLKKIIEVVGGKKKEEGKRVTRPRVTPESPYATCCRTPVGRLPAATTRHHFFCPNSTLTRTTTPAVAPAPLQPSRRAQARRSLVATTQRRDEAARVAAMPPPPTQIDAPSHRKATTTTPDVVPVIPAAAPTTQQQPKEEEKAQQQQPAAATPAAPAAPTPVPQQQQQQPPVGIFEGLAAGTSSHKESVFMKLNKRIAALELNMSLSSEYLSELSRQYIANTDEQKKAMERTRLTAERVAADAARTVNETVRDELFTLRKEMDALSAWLASLRAQAGGVVLAAPRRLTGATHQTHDDDGDGATTATERSRLSHGGRPASTSGHHHHHSGEDYVSYEEHYEQEQGPVCHYRQEEERGRTYGPQPRPDARHASDDEEERTTGAEEDADAFDLRHFDHHSDGIWTTEQVLYAVLGAQALTVVLVLAMQFCYARIFGRRRTQQLQPMQQPAAAVAAAPPAPPLIDAAEVERLIAAALERRAERERTAAPPPLTPPLDPATPGASPRSSASSVTSSSEPTAPLSGASSKKKRRQRRSTTEQAESRQQQQQATTHNHHQNCRQCGSGNLDWDSAMDSSLPSPSQTGSEEEYEAPPSSGASQALPLSDSAPSPSRPNHPAPSPKVKS
ncbi:hypothetical protein PFISCL1PPCAC_23184, partial [Pristionchus fissidentatus]